MASRHHQDFLITNLNSDLILNRERFVFRKPGLSPSLNDEYSIYEIDSTANKFV